MKKNSFFRVSAILVLAVLLLNPAVVFAKTKKIGS